MVTDLITKHHSEKKNKVENKLTTFDDIKDFVDSHIINGYIYNVTVQKDGSYMLRRKQFDLTFKCIELSSINGYQICTFLDKKINILFQVEYKPNRKKIISEILK